MGESKSVGETRGVGGRVGGNVGWSRRSRVGGDMGESGMGVWVKEGVWVRIAMGLWVIVGENSSESVGTRVRVSMGVWARMGVWMGVAVSVGGSVCHNGDPGGSMDSTILGVWTRVWAKVGVGVLMRMGVGVWVGSGCRDGIAGVGMWVV